MKYAKWCLFTVLGLAFLGVAVALAVLLVVVIGYVLNNFGYNILIVAVVCFVVWMAQLIGQIVFFEVYSRITGKKVVFDDKWNLKVKEDSDKVSKSTH